MKKSENRIMGLLSLRATIKGSNIIVTVIRRYDGAIQQEVIPCEFLPVESKFEEEESNNEREN